MEELVRYLISKLIDDTENIDITTTEESDKVSIISVKLDKENIGRVIGRNGKIAGSIRTIVKSASAKTGKRYIVKIGERD